ncbi:ovalbumin-like [Eschrichtius robustus]|uniref:ovalbumin-like n=1 Tax=Eschrichtius robustus TaxID=9764 RepID=UPI0035C1D983
MGSLSAANSKLCFDVFKEMNYDHMIENLIFSPLSLLSALAVVLFGARGDSASQMEKSQSKPVQMMRLQGHFKLDSITEPRVQVLEMPDVEGHLSMVIVLPREEVGLGQVTNEITYEKLSNWIGSANMKDTAVVLYLPQLRLHGYYEDLTSILAALGMTDVFNHSRTNLSGITAGGDLRVSKIIHKAMLEVVETGSEFTLNNQTSKFENPELFKVDHPFLFFILHKETKMILFYGRVCNP